MAGRISLKQLNASGATPGQVPTWVDGAVLQWKPQPVLPANLSTATSEAPSSTGSAIFQIKLTLTTPALPVGTYFVSWYAEFEQSSGSGSGEVQTLVDGVVVADFQNKFALMAAFTPFNGFYLLVVGSVAAHTVVIQYRVPTGGGTVTIQRARAALWQVA